MFNVGGMWGGIVIIIFNLYESANFCQIQLFMIYVIKACYRVAMVQKSVFFLNNFLVDNIHTQSFQK